MVITNTIYSWYNKYNKYINYLLIGVLISALGWYSYSWYKKRLEYSAQQDFSVVAEDYYKLFGSFTHDKEWKEIERGLSMQAKKHSNTSFEPFILAYYADALIQQGKLQEALTIFDKLIKFFTPASPFYYIYSIKRAMVKIDLKDEKIRQEGFKELDQLSLDKNNMLREMALYYKGYFTWINGDAKKAREIWQDALKIGNPQSAWLQLIYLRLEEVVA